MTPLGGGDHGQGHPHCRQGCADRQTVVGGGGAEPASQAPIAGPDQPRGRHETGGCMWTRRSKSETHVRANLGPLWSLKVEVPVAIPVLWAPKHPFWAKTDRTDSNPLNSALLYRWVGVHGCCSGPRPTSRDHQFDALGADIAKRAVGVHQSKLVETPVHDLVRGVGVDNANSELKIYEIYIFQWHSTII